MIDLKNKHVVITGASSGVGEKLAYEVTKNGGIPILIARSLEKLAQIAKTIETNYGIQAKYYSLDVVDTYAVKQVFNRIYEEVGNIDILVNNAGYGIFDSVIDADLNDIRGMLEVNVIGVVACTKAVLPQMLEKNAGHIIVVASQAGKMATPKSGGYAASKHAVLGFTNSLRMELAGTNVRVSAVNPGPIETAFFDRADKTGNYVNSVKKYILSSDEVAQKMVDLMKKPKRELNLPVYLNWGSTLYNLFPNLADKFARKLFDKK